MSDRMGMLERLRVRGVVFATGHRDWDGGWTLYGIEGNPKAIPGYRMKRETIDMVSVDGEVTELPVLRLFVAT